MIPCFRRRWYFIKRRRRKKKKEGKLILEDKSFGDVLEKIATKKLCDRDFPGGVVVRTPHLHCRRHGIGSWLGN